MNKARPTISGSLIKHRAYLMYIKYNKNVNNNTSSSSKEEEEEVNENFEIKD
jgi:hypothetical protein